jgi:nucleotide-binding universal stress UspA family protein
VNLVSWLPKKTVLVPIDFSDRSFAAIDVAIDLVESAGCIHVLHVLPDLSAAEPGIVWEAVNDANRRRHAEEALRERTLDAKYAGFNLSVEFGDAGKTIAENAGRIGAELIVLSSHGRHGLQRLLIGSVAERVLRLAHCPVLVLREAPDGER